MSIDELEAPRDNYQAPATKKTYDSSGWGYYNQVMAYTTALQTVDLFAGCGGLSLGMQKAGFKIVAAFDHWWPAVDVYRANFEHPMIDLNLGSLSGDYSQIAKYKPQCIVGGPPCQDFSSAGLRDHSGDQANLTPVFADIVQELKPALAIMENVDQALKSPKYQQAKQTIIDAGYGVTLMVINASLCGVPQKRKRLFLIAEHGGTDDAFKAPLLAGLAQDPMTIRDYLSDALGLEHYYRHPRNYNRRGIYSIDEPSPTVRGVNRPLPAGYKGHRADTAPRTASGLRALTTIERSYLQTFPKKFNWLQHPYSDGSVDSSGELILKKPISKTNLEQLIGNAVPVNLAKYVGRVVQQNHKS